MRRVALVLGPTIFIALLLLPAPASMDLAAWRVVALAAWMAIWWLSAVVPLEATALLPIGVLPVVGVGPVGEVTRAYADPIIFLFLGGFFLAATLERWNLHRRFALATVRVVGTDARRVLLGFMLASAFASMWISNTATAVMMLPIAMAVASGAGGGFPKALLLGFAYACSIGGVATLFGTQPNAILAGAVGTILGEEMDFGRWLAIGLPIAIPMFVLCWIWLVWLFDVRGTVDGLEESLEVERRQMGRLSGGERAVLAVFVATAMGWILRAPKVIGSVRVPGLTDLVPGLSDAGIAMAAAVLLFVLPGRVDGRRTLLDWDTARKVPWGILLLFGGGLALAAAFESSGLTEWLGYRLQGLQGVPFPLVVFVTAGLFVVLTELTSNTATAALGMPLMAGVAAGLGVAALPLMVTVALAASMAFMLPVATPPNAIVFGSGKVPSQAMARAGLGLNLVAVGVVSLMVWLRFG